jgi:hypothetical protein
MTNYHTMKPLSNIMAGITTSIVPRRSRSISCTTWPELWPMSFVSGNAEVCFQIIRVGMSSSTFWNSKGHFWGVTTFLQGPCPIFQLNRELPTDLWGSICVAFQESNRLQFTNDVDEDCRVLSEMGSAPHDSLIPHLIHSQELMDDLRSISGVCDGDNSPAPDGIRALNLRRIFRKRLQILEQSFSRVAWSNSESFRGLYSVTYADRVKSRPKAGPAVPKMLY